MTMVLNRKYSLSDSELVVFGKNLCSNITRDITEFTTRGVTATEVTALGVLIDAFEAFPKDSYYKADVSIAVEEKNNTRTLLEVKVRDVVQCAIIKWGDSSPKYKKFGTVKMSSYSDKEFFTMCRQVVKTATDYLSELADVGLTQAMIDDVDDGADTLETKFDNLNTAVTTRDIKTGERIEDGNELYSYVSKYCTIGKIIWDDVDETKYNDYVIYPTEHSGLSKPQNVSADYDPLTPPNINLSWDAVAEATSYDVYYNDTNIGSPAGNFNLLDNYASSPVEVAAVIDRRYYFKIKAKNATKTSDYSDEVYVDVPVA